MCGCAYTIEHLYIWVLSPLSLSFSNTHALSFSHSHMLSHSLSLFGISLSFTPARTLSHFSILSTKVRARECEKEWESVWEGVRESVWERERGTLSASNVSSLCFKRKKERNVKTAKELIKLYRRNLVIYAKLVRKQPRFRQDLRT